MLFYPTLTPAVQYKRLNPNGSVGDFCDHGKSGGLKRFKLYCGGREKE